MTGVLPRLLAILVELVLLMAILYFMLNGVRLILFDVGLKPKYSKIISLMLIAVGGLLVVFLVSYLLAFYPTI